MKTFLYYFFGTIFLPKRAFRRLAGARRQLARGLGMVLIFGLLCAGSSAALALAGAVPMVPPFIPIPVENYYFWQMIFSLPLFILAWLLAAGVIHLLGWGGASGSGFKGTLGITGLALAVPFLLVWIPETAAAILMHMGMTQEELAELLSTPGLWPVLLPVYLLAAIAWTYILLALDASVSRKIHWARACLVALIATAVFWGLLVIFMR